jgi:pimeloyl-ACP methyl ester carboxylesterase
MSQSYRDFFFDANGLQLHGTIRGDAAKPAIVFLHGFMDHARSWDFTRDALGGDYFTVALDFRGFGDSAWNADGSYFFAEYQYDVTALVNALGQREVILVGHSMGGNVASQWAGVFPARVKQLILVEGFGPPERTSDEFPERTATWLRGLAAERKHPRIMGSLEEVAARLQESNAMLTEERAAFLALHATRETAGGYTWKFDPAHRLPNPQPYLPEQFFPFWKRITAPTLAIHGANGYVSVDAMAERYRHIPHLETRIIPDAGHNIHVDQPEALAEAIRLHIG